MNLLATLALLFAAEDLPPIKALLVTGGCCHDYPRQQLIIPQGVEARTGIKWTVVFQGGKTTNTAIPLYDNPDWAKGYDVVVHNECFADVKDKDFIERILKPHREGLPALVIHCAMHCYRAPDDKWFKFCGVRSHNHGAHYGYAVENRAADNPIMGSFPKSWEVKQGELYNIAEVYPGTTVLAQAPRKPDQQQQPVIWTSQYGKGKVFGTTIGHYNSTMVDPVYLDTLTRGILWAVGRDPNSLKKTTPQQDETLRGLAVVPVAGQADAGAPTGKCCGDGNLALGKACTSSSTQNPHQPNKAVDGELGTRWCPNGAGKNEWWQVDLGKPEHVKSCRIHWEGNGKYYYKLEASADAKEWKLLSQNLPAAADAPKEKGKKAKGKQVGGAQRIVGIKADSPDTRYLKVTFLGSSAGGWGSFWEFEAYDKELPPLPKGVADKLPGPDKKAPPTVADVKAPPGFDVTIFAAPPQVNYPVQVSCSPDGAVFVAVDEQGSLGKLPGRGKVVRCVDTDGDGKADKFTDFCKVDHPRGLVADGKQLWVLHPPELTLFEDTNGDGVAEKRKTLATGLSTKQVAARGADHTTNGIRLGIDGWIYIAVGDFGILDAKGTDGRTISKRGGGVARIRPDGTNLEIYAWGLRNIVDVAVDPFGNVFTRDNTNDGGGWDVRVSHILQGADYGYPSKYINFPDEIMPPLKMVGGGSGCGALYLQDDRWPKGFNDNLYTCDWGTSKVYRHELVPAGPTFAETQHEFLSVPRVTDCDLDTAGRLFVTSWKNGNFNYDGPNVGFVAMVTPKGLAKAPRTPPKPKPSRPDDPIAWMNELRSGVAGSANGNDAAVANRLLALTRRAKDFPAPTGKPQHSQPDPGAVIPHLAVKALVALDAHEACVKALDTEDREAALRALRQMPTKGAVDAVLGRLAKERDPALRLALLGVLARQHWVEAEYTRGDWWGTRPDTRGPLYDKAEWSESPRIVRVLKTALAEGDSATAVALKKELARCQVTLPGMENLVAAAEADVKVVVPKADPMNPKQIANLGYDAALKDALATKGDAKAGEKLFKSQSCVACHTFAHGQLPKGPHLVDIGKRYKRAELVESLLKPSAKLAQGFESWQFQMADGTSKQGFVTGEAADVVRIRQNDGASFALPQKEIEARKKVETSMMPQGLCDNLEPAQLADLLAYLESLR